MAARHTRRPYTLAVLALALGLTPAFGFECQVSRTVDGDTFHCTSGVKVRVSGINAPDRGEHGYADARNALADMLLDRTVTCEPTGTTYDRIAAICYLDGEDIGAIMVGRALARDCPRYSGGRYAGVEDERHLRLPEATFCEP